MAKLEPSFLNQENFSTSSMMLTTMESPLSPSLQIAKELFQEVWKERLEYGESDLKLKLWRHLSKNTEEESVILELVKILTKLFHHLLMGLALFGTSRLILESFASLNRPCSNKYFTIQMNRSFLLQDQIERSFIGTAMTDKLFECLMGLTRAKLMP
jgi:hypothetical protein